MSGTRLVSVVIPTLHREQHLCATLRYFVESKSHSLAEVIVIDQSDAHEPETEHFLAGVADRIRYMRVPYKSLPRARNHGVTLARGEIVLFVDDDVLPSVDFINAHVAAYDDPAVIGVTGPSPLPGWQLLSCEQVGHEFWQDLKRNQMRFDVDFPFDAVWAMGCNMSFRRKCILEVGGFDENFFDMAIGEDAEFSARIRSRCGRIRYEPAARLVHDVATKGGCRSSAFYGRRLLAFVANSIYHRSRIRNRGVRYSDIYRLFRQQVLNRDTWARGNITGVLPWFLRGLAVGMSLSRAQPALPLSDQRSRPGAVN